MLDSSIRIVAVAALATWLSSPVAAQTPGDCDTLEDLKIEDTNLLSSAVVPAADDLPEYCRVLGYVRPAINFEIRLPTTDLERQVLHGRLRRAVRQGRSGPAGLQQRHEPRAAPQLRGLTMDGGHWGSSLGCTWIQVRTRSPASTSTSAR